MTYDASSVGECHKCVYMCLYVIILSNSKFFLKVGSTLLQIVWYRIQEYRPQSEAVISLLIVASVEATIVATIDLQPRSLFCKIRGIVREKERERNISVRVPLVRPQLGTRPTTQECTLTGNQTSDPLVHRLALYLLSHTSQSYSYIIFFTSMNNLP